MSFRADRAVWGMSRGQRSALVDLLRSLLSQGVRVRLLICVVSQRLKPSIGG